MFHSEAAQWYLCYVVQVPIISTCGVAILKMFAFLEGIAHLLGLAAEDAGRQAVSISVLGFPCLVFIVVGRAPFLRIVSIAPVCEVFMGDAAARVLILPADQAVVLLVALGFVTLAQIEIGTPLETNAETEAADSRINLVEVTEDLCR